MPLVPAPMPPPSRFELIVQESYLILTHPQLNSCLFVSRTPSAKELASNQLDLSVERKVDLHHLQGRRMPFDAVFGIYWLLRGPYLALVTDSKVVARGIDDKEIRQVTRMELMLIPTQELPMLNDQQEEDEQKYMAMLTDQIKDQKLMFCYDFDITHTLQRISGFDGSFTRQSIAKRADQRFCWNYPACALFIEKELFEWMVPIMQAYVEVTEDICVKDQTFKMLYISRRSCRRQGMRFTMRGIDEAGNVANFVETEQICLFENGRQTSFVQIRGSIPVFWSSPVTMKYAPKVFQRSVVEKDVEAFQLHAYEMMNLYGRVVIVNLIDKKKEQLKLGEAFAKTVADAATKDSHILANIRLVWFDFHHECRKMRYQNLEKLIKQVDDDFLDYGYFTKNPDGSIGSTQSGVVRTNCMDNLDRTNVVQSLFGRRSLMLQLNEISALHGNVLNSPFQELEVVFKRVWGNNADAISVFYAGTGALKTDFTRTGKRTKRGALQDGYNSCMRYIINNFLDGQRQDVVDLLLARYQISRSRPSPFSVTINSRETLDSLLKKLVLFVFTLFMIESYRDGNQSFMYERLMRAVLYTLVVLLGLFAFVVKKGGSFGKRMVCLPCLRPQDGCAPAWNR